MLKNKASKKTIFFLINSMENGGAERVLSNIIPLLSKQYDIKLILLKDSRFYGLPKNTKIIPLSGIQNNFLMIPLFPIYIWRLKKLIKQYQPHKIVSFLEIANFVNILTNKQAIVSFRISLVFFNKGFINKIYRFLINSLYPKAQKIIVNSEENRQDLSQQLNISLDKIRTIYNPINISQIKQSKNKFAKLPFQRTTNHKIFITVGRLNQQKNLPALLKTFQNISPNNILLIVGEGPERNNLENFIKKHNLQKQIFLLGRQKNVYKYLNIADYFIFSSKAEGFPNVLIEAMACNLPIITSDFKTGAREIIDPDLSFQEKIKYPHYGPNGALLSLENFENDFQKINFEKLNQEKISLERFKMENVIKKWQIFIN